MRKTEHEAFHPVISSEVEKSSVRFSARLRHGVTGKIFRLRFASLKMTKGERFASLTTLEMTRGGSSLRLFTRGGRLYPSNLV